MRRLLVTIVALLLAPAVLRGQTSASPATKPTAPAQPAAAAQKPAAPAPSNQQPAASNQQPAPSNQQPATSNQPAAKPAATTPAPAQPAAKPAAPTPAPSNQQPAASNQQPATSNQPAAPAAKPAAPAASNQQPATSNQSAPPQPENFTYNPDGRRDPFTNLIGSGGTDPRPSAGRRGDGAAGLSVGEISVRGVLQSRDGLIAMVQGPDNKTYIVHQGDRLLDGSIKSITTQGLICIQDVNDPLSLVKQREVSKLLRSLEGVK